MSHRTPVHSTMMQSLSAVALGVAAAAAVTLAPAAAHAQDPNAAPPPGYAPPPAGYAPPPAGYAPPPAGYAPPPGYAPAPGYVPPPGYAPPPQGYYAPAQGPRVISDWDEGQAVPAGYHKSTKIRTGLVVGGAVTFGCVYLITALVGAVASDVSNDEGTNSGNVKLLLIPIVGPFTLLGAGAGATADLFLVIDGLAQAAGVGMFIAGIAAPRTVLVRNDVGFTIRPKPMTFGTNSGGMGVVGTF